MFDSAKVSSLRTGTITTIPGYVSSKAFGYEGLGSLTVHSYLKQFYFELDLEPYPEEDTAKAHGKMFLDYFESKVP